MYRASFIDNLRKTDDRIKYKNNDFLYLFSVEMEVYLKSGFRFRKSRLCDILTSFDLLSWLYQTEDFVMSSRKALNLCVSAGFLQVDT